MFPILTAAAASATLRSASDRKIIGDIFVKMTKDFKSSEDYLPRSKCPRTSELGFEEITPREESLARQQVIAKYVGTPLAAHYAAEEIVNQAVAVASKALHGLGFGDFAACELATLRATGLGNCGQLARQLCHTLVQSGLDPKKMLLFNQASVCKIAGRKDNIVDTKLTDAAISELSAHAYVVVQGLAIDPFFHIVCPEDQYVNHAKVKAYLARVTKPGVTFVPALYAAYKAALDAAPFRQTEGRADRILPLMQAEIDSLLAKYKPYLSVSSESKAISAAAAAAPSSASSSSSSSSAASSHSVEVASASTVSGASSSSSSLATPTIRPSDTPLERKEQAPAVQTGVDKPSSLTPMQVYKQALAHYKNNDFSSAITNVTTALGLFQEQKKDTRAEQASCHSALASCYRDINNLLKAIEHCERARDLRQVCFPTGHQQITDIVKKLSELRALLSAGSISRVTPVAAGLSLAALSATMGALGTPSAATASSSAGVTPITAAVFISPLPTLAA
ncbi:hypothetical protein BH10PSE19_BH10PSE19_09000 [soil metagenome]